MRKEYYNYIVKMPAVLHEMFRQKVYDNHFLDMKTVMTHLINSYICTCDGKKVSRATQLVLSHMKKNPDMEFFFATKKSPFLFLKWITLLSVVYSVQSMLVVLTELN